MAQEVEVKNWPWTIGSGLSLGEVGAFFLSYMKWHCGVLAIVHGSPSWIYVFWYLFHYGAK